MNQGPQRRMAWRENPNAVELGFEYYLDLLERRLQGERISLVQSLRRYYRDELGVDLRETQARGLMHKASSVFIDYVREVTGQEFVPGIQHWEQEGLQLFTSWRQEFVHARSQPAADLDEDILERILERSEGRTGAAPREQIVYNRIIRDSALSRFMKALYQYQCQLCGRSLPLPRGRLYAESHHIRPLGRRHQGIDKETNILVLCPNHHAMMDFGAIAVHPDTLNVVSIERRGPEHNTSLQLVRHPLEKEFLEYHLRNIFNKVA